MTYTADQLKETFQNKFNMKTWYGMLQNLFHASKLRTTPEPLSESTDKEQGYFIGHIDAPDNYCIGLFYYRIQQKSVLHKRVGLRQLVKSFVNQNIGLYDAALVVFESDTDWRLSFVSDIKGDATSPKRYTYVFGSKHCLYKTPISRFIALQNSNISFAAIKEAFSVEGLSEQFYNDLFKWYLWAVEDAEVSFPNIMGIMDETKRRTIKCEHIIRLITRLLFCWFIKQKHLIPNEIFTSEWTENILSHFNKLATNEGEYYNAILQNLFFATLNNEIKSRKWATNNNFQGKDPFYGIKCFYRDNDGTKPSFFSSGGKALMEKTFAQVPYLNGGLFECLDKEINIDNNKVVYIDGFSRDSSIKKRASIPNILFFSENENQLGLFPLLKRYNFTIDENSQDDVEISLDPELLGRVFENLLADYNPETQESARKATGSFYTPRTIVDYMVNESLITYLSEKGLDINKLRNLINTNTPVKDSDWSESNKETIISSLKNIRILDPACGSGAFPMGCLLKIVNVIQQIDTNTDNLYELKLAIINNCIYGIDIQPIAMMISKLRFFISLICEQHDIDLTDSEHNFGINTLPNLETKFVAANSLISAEIHEYEGDWTKDKKLTQLKEELLTIRKSQFLSTSRMEKLEKRREDRNKRKEIHEYIIKNISSTNEDKIAMCESQIETLKAQLPQYKGEKWVDDWIQQQPTFFETPQPTLFRHDINKEKREAISSNIKGLEAEIKKEKQKGEIKGFEAAVEQITLWNPYDQNSSSPFFNSEWMFGVKDGFDIVIGNPPYIQLQNNGGELAALYEKSNYCTFTRTGDIYCLFYERGYLLLKQEGLLCFITSNKWMRAGYGEKLREFFANKTNPRLLIDFAGVKIFESATVDTNILLFSKEKNQHKTMCASTNKQTKESLNNLSNFVEQQHSFCDFSNSDSWVILSPIEQSIKRKIEAVGTPLKDWDINIYRGVLTGYNEAFIISTDKRKKILSNCQTEDERKRTEELIRPILRGRDIKRYVYNWANLWLIYLPWHFPFQFDNSIQGASKKAEKEFLRLYPTVYAYMLNYKEPLSKRNQMETGIRYEWYAMQRWGANYWEDFDKPKIQWKRVGSIIRFAYDESGMMPLDSTCFATGRNIKYLCCVLNSTMGHYLLKDAPKTGTGDLLISVQAVNPIRIPFIKSSSKFCEFLSSISFKMLNEEKKTQIDQAVYQLYGLSNEEISYIEENTN